MKRAPRKMIVLAAGLGSRLRAVTGGRPKQLIEVGGMTLLERDLKIAELLGLEPVVVARPEALEHFRGCGADLLAEGSSTGMLVTLHNTRRHVHDDFLWIGGDVLFTEVAPLRRLLQAYREGESTGAYLYSRSSRFKTKLTLDPAPEVLVTREGAFPWSVPNFGIQSPRLYAYMLEREIREPRENFLQQALAGGEPILFAEYRAPVFEIDTPDDLAAARRHFARWAQAS